MFFLLPDDDVRVSDAERDAAVEFLNRHYAEGRLTEAEHSARVDAVYAAQWDSQLERLTADLPQLPAQRAASGLRLRPVVGVGIAAAAAVGALTVVPPDVWAMLLGVVLPLLMMLLFTVAPIALPVLALAFIARAVVGPARRPWELEERIRR
jgi:Domain of unknown function (DUF1707)